MTNVRQPRLQTIIEMRLSDQTCLHKFILSFLIEVIIYLKCMDGPH